MPIRIRGEATLIFYLLNKQQKVLKAISSEKAIEAHLVEQINQAGQFTLSLPLKDRLAPNIFFALFQKPDSTDYLLFKLISEDVQTDRVTYTGVEAAYDELKSYGLVKDIRPAKRTAREILEQILHGTRWEVGYIDSTSPVSTNFYYQTYLESIQQLVSLFDLEAVFTYNFDTKLQVITRRVVSLYSQQGRRTGKRFEYGSNLLEVTREEDSQDIVTALVGRGKGIEEYNEATGEATGGYSRKISFSDVVWSKDKGDPVDKPAGQEYVEDPEATKVFGYDDGKPRIAVIEFDDIEDPVELLKATWTSLKTSDHPKVSFKAKVTDVGDLQLGDTVAIIRHEISIEYFTRVFKVDHDLLDKNNSTIELGDDMSSHSLYSYISDVANVANQANQNANHASVAAGFKNKNYYSTTKPTIANEGDNLWLNLGNGEFEHWVWHNHQWQFINSTQDLHNVEQSVKDQQAELDKVKQNANDTNSKVDSLSQNTTANIAAIKTDLKGAQDDIASAKQDIQSNGNKITDVDKKVDGLSSTVASNTGNISKVSQTADELKATVASNTNAISSVTQTANELKTAVGDNTANISKISQTADGLKTEVANNTANISKVTQTADGLKTTVASNTNAISSVTQKADSISNIINDENTGLSAVLQKVDSVSSVVNDKERGLSAVNQKADSIATQVAGKADTSQLIQLNDQIKTKVESKDFTSQVTQLNNAINLKVSKGDVLGQINIEAGSTLIQNKKLYLDADSVVFSGKAFIPDAAITNISADKINAGTLDAGKINVININADNIHSGTLIGNNSYFDLANGTLNVRDSKGNSVFLSNGSIDFTTLTEWSENTSPYGKIKMYQFQGDSDIKNSIMDIEGNTGFFVHNSDVQAADVAATHKWEIKGLGEYIYADAKKYKGQDPNVGGQMTVAAGGYLELVAGDTTVSMTDYYKYCASIYLAQNPVGKSGDPYININAPRINMGVFGGTNKVTVQGDFNVWGSKNATVPSSKGMIAINAYETAEYYFGDIGRAKTDKNGQILIQIDPLFLETVNTSVPYHVFVSPYGKANVWVEQMDRNSFLVKSDKPFIDFSWEIKAKRKGYEDHRLEVVEKDIPKKAIPQYKEKGIL